jgi:hypothetical protein
MTVRIESVADLERLLLEEMQDDYVGLWEIARLVRTELGFENETGIFETTLRVVEDMVLEGLICPGVATAGGRFESWPVDPEQALHTINTAWEELGRTPRVGEIAWFDLTDRGEKVTSAEDADSR